MVLSIAFALQRESHFSACHFRNINLLLYDTKFENGKTIFQGS